MKCAFCGVHACYTGKIEDAPDDCPMKTQRDLLKEAEKEYLRDDMRNLTIAASEVEAEGYMKWCRLREIMEFARKINARKIGLAFCIGLSREAREVVKVFEANGFGVFSVCCKCGDIKKGELGVPEQFRIRREDEAACSPIAQALLLKQSKTDLNVLLGLCVGHDSLFIKYSEAPVTVLAAKDRVLGHNPLAAIYSSYYKSKLTINKP